MALTLPGGPAQAAAFVTGPGTSNATGLISSPNASVLIDLDHNQFDMPTLQRTDGQLRNNTNNPLNSGNVSNNNNSQNMFGNTVQSPTFGSSPSANFFSSSNGPAFQANNNTMQNNNPFVKSIGGIGSNLNQSSFFNTQQNNTFSGNNNLGNFSNIPVRVQSQPTAFQNTNSNISTSNSNAGGFLNNMANQGTNNFGIGAQIGGNAFNNQQQPTFNNSQQPTGFNIPVNQQQAFNIPTLGNNRQLSSDSHLKGFIKIPKFDAVKPRNIKLDGKHVVKCIAQMEKNSNYCLKQLKAKHMLEASQIGFGGNNLVPPTSSFGFGMNSNQQKFNQSPILGGNQPNSPLLNFNSNVNQNTSSFFNNLSSNIQGGTANSIPFNNTSNVTNTPSNPFSNFSATNNNTNAFFKTNNTNTTNINSVTNFANPLTKQNNNPFANFNNTTNNTGGSFLTNNNSTGMFSNQNQNNLNAGNQQIFNATQTLFNQTQQNNPSIGGILNNTNSGFNSSILQNQNQGAAYPFANSGIQTQPALQTSLNNASFSLANALFGSNHTQTQSNQLNYQNSFAFKNNAFNNSLGPAYNFANTLYNSTTNNENLFQAVIFNSLIHSDIFKNLIKAQSKQIFYKQKSDLPSIFSTQRNIYNEEKELGLDNYRKNKSDFKYYLDNCTFGEQQQFSTQQNNRKNAMDFKIVQKRNERFQPRSSRTNRNRYQNNLILKEGPLDQFQEIYDKVQKKVLHQIKVKPQNLPINDIGILMSPNMDKLSEMTQQQLKSVKNVSVQNKYGRVKFNQPIDLLRKKLSQCIQITQDQIQILDKEWENKRCEIQLKNFNHYRSADQAEKSKIQRKMKRWADRNKIRILNFDDYSGDLFAEFCT